MGRGKNEMKDPYAIDPKIREFLYSEVLLLWETQTARVRDEKINRQKLLSSLGFSVEYFNTLDELEAHELALSNGSTPINDYLCFHNETKPEFRAGYECLLKRLRDTAAHGHYSATDDGRIHIRHRYSPNNKPERTRIVGKLQFPNLKKLIVFIAGEKEHSRVAGQKIATMKS